jgi:ankyrin repeat protein
MLAASNGQTDTVKLLLEKGATIDATNKDGWTAVLLAANHGQTETVKLLLEKGAKIDATENTGWTALMLAASDGRMETVRLLLDKGAEVDKKKPDGLTALMIAAAHDQAEVVRLLLERGADVTAKDGSGQTARNRATKTETVQVLETERLKLAVLLREDDLEAEQLTDELIDSKNKYLPGFLAAATAEQRIALLSGVEKRLVQAQRRIAELNSAAEDAVRQGGDAATFRGRTAKIQAYMSVLKVIQQTLRRPLAEES